MTVSKTDNIQGKIVSVDKDKIKIEGDVILTDDVVSEKSIEATGKIIGIRTDGTRCNLTVVNGSIKAQEIDVGEIDAQKADAPTITAKSIDKVLILRYDELKIVES